MSIRPTGAAYHGPQGRCAERCILITAADSLSALLSRVLITGVGGFIGSALVRRLVAMGVAVTASARRPGRLDPYAAAYRYVACDLRSAEETRAVVTAADPRLVFHLAAHPDAVESGKQTQAVIQHNIMAIANVPDALMTLPAATLIYGDSAKVYGNGHVPYRSAQVLKPLSSYAVSKEAGWNLIDVYRRVHGLQAVGIRPTLVYGPGQGFNLFTYLIDAVTSGREEIALDGGSQTRDPLFIDDVVDAFVAAADRVSAVNGLNVPVGGNREMSVAEIAGLVVSVLGGRQRIQVRPGSVRPTENHAQLVRQRRGLGVAGLDAQNKFRRRPVAHHTCAAGCRSSRCTDRRHAGRRLTVPIAKRLLEKVSRYTRNARHRRAPSPLPVRGPSARQRRSPATDAEDGVAAMSVAASSRRGT